MVLSFIFVSQEEKREEVGRMGSEDGQGGDRYADDASNHSAEA